MMMSSWPRPASPSFAASALGATRMLCSCTSVPRWASAKAKVVKNSSPTTRGANRSFIFKIIGRDGVACNSALTQLTEHLGLDVAAADDGNVHFRFGKLVRVKEKSCRGHGTAGFGHSLPVLSKQLHRFTNLVLGHRDDVIDISADVLEVDWTNALRAKSVSERARNLLGRKLDDLAGTQAGLGVGSEFRLNADHSYLGIG